MQFVHYQATELDARMKKKNKKKTDILQTFEFLKIKKNL